MTKFMEDLAVTNFGEILVKINFMEDLAMTNFMEETVKINFMEEKEQII